MKQQQLVPDLDLGIGITAMIATGTVLTGPGVDTAITTDTATT